MRKPVVDIFRMALDITQIAAKHAVYIYDHRMFVQVAEGFGINGIHHTDYESTITKLNSFGLK